MESSYRLREQQIGRRWVYPYVTESAQHYQVTLAVVIGALETVDQEAPSLHAEVLDVELRNERDQPLEMVQRPEGLLTVVGGPSFTANANYRFLAEQVPAETLYVAIDGERVSFHLTRDRLVEKKSHKEWELWPLSRYLHFLGCKIICFLKKLFGKPRCCVSRFDPPIPRSGCQTGATFARESFHMNADFDSSGDCACRCCEYRQYVRGRFLENGQPARHQLPSGPLDPRVWVLRPLARQRVDISVEQREHIRGSGGLQGLRRLVVRGPGPAPW